MPATETVMGNGGTTVSALPLLVTFRDIGDPNTVERVEPEALEDRFGQGVKLRRITVQITNDDTTTNVAQRLHWLDKYRDLMLDGKSVNDSISLANNLTPGSFRRGQNP